MPHPPLCRALLAACLASCALALPATSAAEPPLAAQLTSRPALRASDEALRTGMTALRARVATALATDHPDEAAYRLLAKELAIELEQISAGYDFHRQSDRHLQWLLGDVAESLTMMQSAPRLAVKQLSLKRIAETLNRYGREYDHPGWIPLQPN